MRVSCCGGWAENEAPTGSRDFLRDRVDIIRGKVRRQRFGSCPAMGLTAWHFLFDLLRLLTFLSLFLFLFFFSFFCVAHIFFCLISPGGLVGRRDGGRAGELALESVRARVFARVYATVWLLLSFRGLDPAV